MNNLIGNFVQFEEDDFHLFGFFEKYLIKIIAGPESDFITQKSDVKYLRNCIKFAADNPIRTN
jgi:hypothetical protein